MLQAVHAGIAGPEVIERNLYAQATQCQHAPTCLIQIPQQGAFGDLQCQLASIGTGFPQDLVQRRHEVVMRKLLSADVDRQTQSTLCHDRPGQQHASLTQHPVAQTHDELGLLGHRNELSRAYQPPFGMLPAYQRLGTHAATARIGLALQIQTQLPVGDAVVQIPGNAHAPIHILGHARLEQHHAARTAQLGLMQGHAGKAQHVMAVAAFDGRLQHGTANAAADKLGFHPAVERKRLLQGLLQGLRIQQQLLLHTFGMLVQAIKNNSKLRSRNTRNPGIVRQNLDQSGPHGLHQLVAVLHAMHIVEDGKAIYVQQQQAMAGILPNQGQLAQMQGQRMAVGQPCERVQVDQVVDTALGQNALGEIALELHIIDDLSLRRANRRHQHRLPQGLTLARAIGHLATP